jgi:hypothetical protein
MAKYLVLIYGDERAWEARSPQARADNEAGHGRFAAAAGGAVLGGGELMPTSTATSLRGTPAGAPTTTDGPFLETKEALGGYYLLEAPDLDAVIALAQQLPEVSEPHGGVEIRPLVDHG